MKLVKVLIPKEYGSFWSSREGKGDVELRGGEVGEVTEREAALYGFEVLKAEAPKPKGNA